MGLGQEQPHDGDKGKADTTQTLTDATVGGEISKVEVIPGTAGDLLQKLSQVDQGLSIAISRDPEGNGYTLLDKSDELATYNFDESDREITDESEWGEYGGDGDYVANCVALFPGYTTLENAMKVSDLVELLAKVDPELKIVLSRDQEGNGYSPADIDDEFEAYFFEDGEISDSSEWDSDLEFVPNCIVLWPNY